MVYPMPIWTVDQLRIECIEAERSFPRRERASHGMVHQRAYQANELAFDRSGDHELGADEGQVDVEEVRPNWQPGRAAGREPGKTKRTLHRWNCEQEGHFFTDCMALQRKIFCFKCGLPDVITPKCTRCNPENSKRNVTVPGQSRSTQYPD